MSHSDRLWGARFSKGPSEAMVNLSRSPANYFRLVPEDLRSSAAHANELVRAGILTGAEGERIRDELSAIEADHAAERIRPIPADEDVHTFLERVLRDRLGDLAGKLRAGRSRNDQAANDLKLRLRGEARPLPLRAERAPVARDHDVDGCEDAGAARLDRGLIVRERVLGRRAVLTPP